MNLNLEEEGTFHFISKRNICSAEWKILWDVHVW